LQFLRDRLAIPKKRRRSYSSVSVPVWLAIGAAWGWQLLGGHVKAFIAIDGWGVPAFWQLSDLPV